MEKKYYLELCDIAKAINVDIKELLSKKNYVNLNIITKKFNYSEPNYMIRNWLRKKEVLNLLNEWELKYNPKFKSKKFNDFCDDLIKSKKFFLVKSWNEKLNGISVKQSFGVGIFVPYEIAIIFFKEINRRNYHQSWEVNYKLLKEYKKEFGHLCIPLDTVYKNKNLGRWVNHQRLYYRNGLLKEEKKQKLEKLGMIWCYEDFKWKKIIDELKRYYKIHGNISVPINYTVNFENFSVNIYTWLSRKRNMKDNLTKKQISDLNSLNFDWTLQEEKIKIAWLRGYNQAKKYYQKNNHLRVQEVYIDEDGFRLGVWIRGQRNKYKENKCSNKQIKMLEKIGMLWEASEQVQTSFEEQAIYYYLKKNFPDTLNRDRKTFGTEIDVFIPSLKIGIEYDGPRHHTKERDLKKNKKIKNKIFLIRVRHKNLPKIEKSNSSIFYIYLNDSFEIEDAIVKIYNILNKKYKQNLNTLEINVERDKQCIYDQMSKYVDSVWNKKYEYCKEYYKIHKNIDIPYGYMSGGYNLGSWVQEQRKSYRLKRLSTQKIKALEELKIKWKYKETVWMNNYLKVKKYFLENNTITITKRNNKSLFYWIHDQKKAYRKGRLNKEKIKLLEDIGIIFENFNQHHFNFMCEKLIEFKKENGHCIVPLKYKTKDKVPLGTWASRMRLMLSNNSLEKYKAEKLIKIGLPNNNKKARTDKWIELLKIYMKQNDISNLPYNYFIQEKNIGKWFYKAKFEFKSGSISKYKIKKLKELGIDFNNIP